MKTRTLLLLALTCGLAIMAAGAVLLVQLTNTEEVAAPVAMGDDVPVGDMMVSVVSSRETGDTLTVDVRLGGTTDNDPASEFRLIAAGRGQRVKSSDCGALAVSQVVECSIDFNVGAADGTSRVLFYERGEHGVRWVLS